LLIKENSNGQTDFEVFGEYGVSIFDYRNVKKQAPSDAFEAKNIIWTYLTVGDSFSLSASGILSFKVSSSKSLVSEHSISPKSSTDIFSSPDRGSSGRENYMEFVVIATSLTESSQVSTVGETYETNPIYKVEFGKVQNTESYKGTTKDGDVRYSIVNMNVSMYPKFSI